jgi:membrane protein implicated in regulation of membrane protease activity
MTTIWWVLAGLAVALELATGTFYLLMIALGLAAGAIASHLGLSPVVQIAAAAVLGGGATAVWHWRRARQPAAVHASENRDVHLDIGAKVHVEAWNPDGTARVEYRGALWSVRLAAEAAAVPGPCVVRAVEGNWLVVAPER